MRDVALFSVALATSTPAAAQDSPDLNAQLYRPAFDSRKTLWADSAGVVTQDVEGSSRLFLNYANDPLVWIDPLTGAEVGVVSDALTLNTLGMVRYNRLRLGVDLPIYLVSASELQSVSSGAGMGDVALDLRLTALDRRVDPIGVGLGGRIALPTATVQTALGSPSPVGELMLLVDKDIEPVYLALNIGTRLAPGLQLDNIDVGNQLMYRFGAAYTLGSTDTGLSVDAVGHVNYTAPLANPAGAPLEILAGGWGRLNNDWVLRGGAGAGVTPGIGSPLARMVLSLAFEKPLEGDKDQDGFLDLSDACPEEAEDLDAFEDDDGCPELDNDQDGIVDTLDQCPVDVEDADGYLDEDGCPDESVKVTFSVVGETGRALPTATLTITGPETLNGVHGFEAQLHAGNYSVEATDLNHTTASVNFTLPGQTEVTVKLAAVPGRLRLEARDPDGRLIPGATYTLDGRQGPTLEDGTVETMEPAGQHTLVVRKDGYASFKHAMKIKPDADNTVVAVLKPSKVKLTRTKIEIADKIYFDTGKATIKEISFELLNEVAQTINDYPEIAMLRIEGHTDARGAESTNQALSEARAASVRTYLLQQGVQEARLTSIGYGESKPIDPATTAAAYDKNRRVEFFVEEWDSSLAPER